MRRLLLLLLLSCAGTHATPDAGRCLCDGQCCSATQWCVLDPRADTESCVDGCLHAGDCSTGCCAKISGMNSGVCAQNDGGVFYDCLP